MTPCGFTWDALVRHAELYGAEEVYETAEQCGWDFQQLGRLAMQLRRIDRERRLTGRDDYRSAARGVMLTPDPWRLDAERRERLVLGLLEAGLPDRRVRDMAGVGQDFVRTRRRALQSGVGAGK